MTKQVYTMKTRNIFYIMNINTYVRFGPTIKDGHTMALIN